MTEGDLALRVMININNDNKYNKQHFRVSPDIGGTSISGGYSFNLTWIHQNNFKKQNKNII